MEQALFTDIDNVNLIHDLKTALEQIAANVKNQVGIRITEKLNRLYNGVIYLPENSQRYILTS